MIGIMCGHREQQSGDKKIYRSLDISSFREKIRKRMSCQFIMGNSSSISKEAAQSRLRDSETNDEAELGEVGIHGGNEVDEDSTTCAALHPKRSLDQSIETVDVTADYSFFMKEAKRPRASLPMPSFDKEDDIQSCKSPLTPAGFKSPVGGTEALLNRSQESEGDIVNLREIIFATPLSSEIKEAVISAYDNGKDFYQNCLLGHF